jgi:TrmH family RNA methyltransferase
VETIHSAHNPRIRSLRRLEEKAGERKARGLFVIEGLRELTRAVKGDYEIDTLYICPSLLPKGVSPDQLCSSPLPPIFSIDETLFRKLAYREGSDGVLALARQKPVALAGLCLSACPLVLVLEAVEKPGNLGAVLRTADAARLDAVLICDPRTDVYNPNVIRASLGAVFTVPLAVGTKEEVLSFLKEKGVCVFAAELEASRKYTDVDFTGSAALVMGTEADGLTGFWLEQADERIKIPMGGVVDSLNISVATAVLVFEAVRQRQA